MTPDQFKEWRESQGLTQEQFGTFLGVDRRTVIAYEKGTSPIPGSVARLGAYIKDMKKQPRPQEIGAVKRDIDRIIGSLEALKNRVEELEV